MKKKIISKLIIASLIVVSFIFSGCQEKPIGGDKDEHGCLVAAGYTWCPSKQKCLRVWEEYCEEYKDNFKIDSFEDCIEAGNPVMESYPRQCSADGQIFTENITEEQTRQEGDEELSDPYYCEKDEDCVVKDVHNCCGYYPRCVNIMHEPDIEAVKKECEGKQMIGVCGFPEIDECRCIENSCKSMQKGEIV